jgi:hypothetical protein
MEIVLGVKMDKHGVMIQDVIQIVQIAKSKMIMILMQEWLLL